MNSFLRSQVFFYYIIAQNPALPGELTVALPPFTRAWAEITILAIFPTKLDLHSTENFKPS